MNGFSSKQLKKLSRPANPAHIYKRNRDGRELSYIPGWVAISEANAVFGYAGWDRQTIHLEKIFDRSAHDSTICGYTARVRIVVRAGETVITREGSGFGYGVARLASDAHEKALKAAETDATKRALTTFGNRFGLSLYQGTKPEPLPAGQNQRCHLTLLAPDGSLLAGDLSPEAYAGGLRQLIEQAQQAAAVDRLIHHNDQALSSLKTGFPNLISRMGRHYVDILRELASNRIAALTRTSTPAKNDAPPPACDEPHEPLSETISIATSQSPENAQVLETASSLPDDQDKSRPVLKAVPSNPKIPRTSRLSFGPSIDKSILTYALERRIRSKQHLSHVAAQPCVICAETPCHAHHITFAQPRGLALKVSDEFTVPLCAVHHNQLHHAPPERTWWKNQGVDPVAIAAKLWEDTLRRLTAQSA